MSRFLFGLSRMEFNCLYNSIEMIDPENDFYRKRM